MPRPRNDVTDAQLAAICGVSQPTIGNWRRRHGMPVGENGEPTLETLFWVVRRKRPSWFRGIEAGVEGVSGGGSPESLDEARLRKLSADADLAELNARERRGELVGRAEAHSEVVEVLVSVRSGVMSAGRRIAGRGEGLDREGLRRVVEDELRLALGSLSEDLRGRGFVDGGGDADVE